jgi:hypothetical protein
VKSLRSSVMATLALILALPALGDSPATKQWVLATAKATGIGGVNLVSSLRIVNPGSATANVTLTYLAQSLFDSNFSATGDNTSASSVTVQVPGGQMLPIEDVIGTKFGGAAPFNVVAGGIKVVSDQPVSVLSRTYVSNAVSATGVPGTYGFSIPAQVDDQAIAAGDTGYVPYIAASPDHNSGFRCNFIMLNTIATTSIVNVTLKKQDGTVIGQRDYTLGNLSAAQQGDIAASFGYAGPDQNLFVVVTVKSGGPVVVGTSIVDNAISSLNYAPPTKTVGGGSTGFKDGVYGIVRQNDNYATVARIDIDGGAPTYLFGTFVSDDCRYYRNIQLISSAYTATPNVAFTKNADGSYSFTGNVSDSFTNATLTGTLNAMSDGGISGTITVSFISTDSVCAGKTITSLYQGHFAAPMTY